jgi:hypothetical protein
MAPRECLARYPRTCDQGWETPRSLSATKTVAEDESYIGKQETLDRRSIVPTPSLRSEVGGELVIVESRLGTVPGCEHLHLEDVYALTCTCRRELKPELQQAILLCVHIMRWCNRTECHNICVMPNSNAG